MRYAVVENGFVVNIVISDSAIFENWVACDDFVAIGWIYADGVFSQPETEE